MAFTEKLINLTFQLSTSQPPGPNSGGAVQQWFTSANGQSGDTVRVTGTRTQVSATISLGKAFDVHVRVYGLSPSLLNKLSGMYAAQVVAMQNHLTIEAGDANGMAVVGSDLLITEAWLDLNNQPDSVLTLACADVGGTLRLAPIPPTSAQGSANAATLLQTLCSQFGLTLENNGVNVQIATPYLCGAMLEQVERICQAANLSWGIEGKTLWVYPYGSYRTNQSVVDVGAGTSTPLVGYPTYSQGGLACTTLFNPNIRMGAQIKVNSSLIRAQGIWNVNGVCHALESQTPGGQWFTSVQTVSPNLPS